VSSTKRLLVTAMVVFIIIVSSEALLISVSRWNIIEYNFSIIFQTRNDNVALSIFKKEKMRRKEVFTLAKFSIFYQVFLAKNLRIMFAKFASLFMVIHQQVSEHI
jgi:hypothetical protein